MVIDPVYLLVGLLIWGLIGYVVHWAMGAMGVPPPIDKVIIILLIILFVLWLISALGLGLPVLRIGRSG
jgi:hypothetical protein